MLIVDLQLCMYVLSYEYKRWLADSLGESVGTIEKVPWYYGYKVIKVTFVTRSIWPWPWPFESGLCLTTIFSRTIFSQFLISNQIGMYPGKVTYSISEYEDDLYQFLLIYKRLICLSCCTGRFVSLLAGRRDDRILFIVRFRILTRYADDLYVVRVAQYVLLSGCYINPTGVTS